MNSLTKDLPPVLHLVVAFFVGAFVALLLSHFSTIEVNGAISAGQLIQYLVTFLSAILITLCFRRVLETETREKDLIFNQLDQMLILVHDFGQLGNKQELSKVTSSLKSLNMKSSFLNGIGVQYKLSDDVKDTMDFTSEIKMLKALATETPHHTKEISGPILLSVENNVVSWTGELRTRIDVQIEKLKRSVFHAQMAVNQA